MHQITKQTPPTMTTEPTIKTVIIGEGSESSEEMNDLVFYPDNTI